MNIATVCGYRFIEPFDDFTCDLPSGHAGHHMSCPPEASPKDHAPQPVAAILNESEDIESAVVQRMEQEYS